ncbi:MAG: PqqD family protein [Candidatus Limnocylindria bacterium]
MERRILPVENVIGTELGGEAVLLNTETGVYFGLNSLGTRIWTLIGGGTSEDTLLVQLQSEYEVDAAQLRSDVSEFVGVLASKSLVQVDEH